LFYSDHRRHCRTGKLDDTIVVALALGGSAGSGQTRGSETVILRLVILRCCTAAITLLFVSIIVFTAVELLPGDVATSVLGRFAGQVALNALREQLHLSDPPLQRYLLWLSGIAHGDLGIALSSQRQIVEILGPRVTNTLILAAAALLLYVPMALIPAIVQAANRDRPLDHILSTGTLILASVPDFLLALLLLVLFVVVLPLLPAASLVTDTSDLVTWVRALILPALTLALVMAVYAARMLRDNLIDILQAPYVVMATLRGLPRWRVILRHALPNAITPTLNITALNLTYLAGGVVIVEKVFGFPGFGSLMIDAISFRDVPLIEITILLASTVYIVANLLADIATIILNPKLRPNRA
jgi:peptide/nickel transport system permease protein